MRVREQKVERIVSLYRGWTFLLCVWGATFALFVQLNAFNDSAQEARTAMWEEVQARVPAQSEPVPEAPPARADDLDLLVEAIILVESAGDPSVVGSAGERGLMQIKYDTWWVESRKVFGKTVSFEAAFDPGINRHVGRGYLVSLREMLNAYRHQWKADERALLLASYNAGPGHVQRAGFDLKRLPESVRDYVDRAETLYEMLLAGDVDPTHHMMTSRASK